MSITLSAWSIFGLGVLAGAPLWVLLTCLTFYFIGKAQAAAEKEKG